MINLTYNKNHLDYTLIEMVNVKAFLKRIIISVNVKISDKIFMFLNVLKTENDFSICPFMDLLLAFKNKVILVTKQHLNQGLLIYIKNVDKITNEKSFLNAMPNPMITEMYQKFIVLETSFICYKIEKPKLKLPKISSNLFGIMSYTSTVVCYKNESIVTNKRYMHRATAPIQYLGTKMIPLCVI